MEDKEAPTAPIEESNALATLSIKELKSFLDERGVSYADCFEKSDLLARAKDSLHIPTKKQPKSDGNRNSIH